MRSSSGKYFITLDHVRAVAIFMVVTWHFTHARNGYPVPFNYVRALFPFSILDEGHTGVALFMTLSGYLFAKLLDGKAINYGSFIWNRILRLLPLLMIVIIIIGVKRFFDSQILEYVHSIEKGILFPTLPNGAWSITVEFHFYLILPLCIWLFKKSKLWPISIIVASIMLRIFLYRYMGQIQTLAYSTIIGRIDQFMLGMIVYQFRSYFANRHYIAIVTIIGLMTFYWYFDLQGGFYNNPSYPSPNPLWIIIPTIEGIAYAICITWYDNSFSPSTSGVSRFIGRIGEFSYSIYLLHFFVVFRVAKFVNERIMSISNFYLACLWSVVFLVFMMIPGYLSFRFIESPFLKLRKSYIKALPLRQDRVDKNFVGAHKG